MTTIRCALATLTALGPVVAAPLFAQEVCEWTLEETLRIGSLDGEDALSAVHDLELGPDGLIYVTQQFIPRVTVFTPDGRPSHSIGRAGSGPGEFDMGPSKLGWVADTLWVTDFSVIHYFGLDGTEIRQVGFMTPSISEGSRYKPGVPLADGTVLPRRSATFFRGQDPGFFTDDRVALPRFSASGERLETIASVPNRWVLQLPGGGFTHHPLGDWADVAWMPVAAAPNGSRVFLVGDVREGGRNPAFDLLALGPAGDTLLKRPIPYDPRPIDRATRGWLTDAFAAYHAGDYDSGPNMMPRSDAERERIRRDARGAITFPENLPPVRQIVPGHDGSIWLLRELDYPELVDRWEVYGPDGAHEGTVLIREGKSAQIPWWPRLELLRATRDEIWGTTVDDLDVPYIHRFRVDRSCN